MPEFSLEEAVIRPRVVDFAPHWFDHFQPFWPCAQRILVVTDYFLNFNENDDFGLTEFLLALESARPSGIKPVIHIAHRSNDQSNASATMKAKFAWHNNFKFVNGTADPALMNVTTRRYDQLYLFAAEMGPSLPATERTVIEDFMNSGGGVFATGDHENLGNAMCGQLLRVKNMRDWSGIPAGGYTRIDTTNEPSPNGVWNFDSQSDPIGQRIFPHFQMIGATHVCHPILKYGTGSSFQSNVVDRLPDHAHESECWLGKNPNLPLAVVSTAEFPPKSGFATPFLPEPVATSMSGGRIDFKGPVNPRSFLAIAAYDGVQTGLGRIVTDATWHHFVNVNLDGTSTAWRGLRDEVPAGSGIFVPNAHYEKVKAYFRNIASWLGRTRYCHWYAELIAVRYHYILLEEVTAVPKADDLDAVLALGAKVAATLDLVRGQGTAGYLALDMLADVPDLAELIAPDRAEKAEAPRLLGVDPDRLIHAVLGGVARSVFETLPATPQAFQADFKKKKDIHQIADRAVKNGIKEALSGIQNRFAEQAEQANALAQRAKRTTKNS